MPPKKSQQKKSRKAEVPSSNPAVHRALAIPEVLSYIFDAMEKADAATALGVSQLWHKVGLQYIWGELDSIFPILKLISPLRSLRKEDGKFWTFRQKVGDADWERFRMHAEQVKVVRFVSTESFEGASGYLTSEAMAELVLQHPFGSSLLPRLHTLHWENGPSTTALAVIPFLSDQLKTIYLQFGEEVDPSTLQQLLRSLVHRTPQITDFSLDMDVPVGEVEEALVKWLCNIQLLQKVCLPSFYQTKSITAALQNQQDLKDLNIIHGTGRRLRDIDREAGMRMTFRENAFMKLEDLDIDLTFAAANQLFQSPSIPPKLKSLCLCCSHYNSLDELHMFLDSLVSNCPRLEAVSLNLHSQDDAAPAAGPLTFEVLDPLLRCNSLDSLELGHSLPIVLSSEEIHKMAIAWPDLEVLDLNSDPDFSLIEDPSSIGNDLSILNDYANAFPSLTYLGIYIRDATDHDLVDAEAPETRFDQLKTLHVGVSRVPHQDPVAVGVFLENLCGDELPTISNFITGWYQGEPLSGEWYDEVLKWKEVESVMDVMRRRRERIKAEYGVA